MEWYHLHPIAVHFPIAFLMLGLAVDLMAARRPWISKAATGLLWLGTLAAWAALGLGLLAMASDKISRADDKAPMGFSPGLADLPGVSLRHRLFRRRTCLSIWNGGVGRIGMNRIAARFENTSE